MSIKADNFKIMVGGQVVGTAAIRKLTILGTTEKAKESKHEELGKSFDISCNALVQENDLSAALKDMLPGPRTVDVQITRPIGKMPRRMKKADKRDPSGITKFGRKVLRCRRRHTTTIKNAEVVVTQQEKETLTIAITKAKSNTEPLAHVSGEEIKRALEQHSKHQEL